MKQLMENITLRVCSLLLVVASSAMAEETVIHCGHLLDVEKRKIVDDTRILVRDGVITEIGDSVNASADADQVDLSSSYCSPGLMDLHTHFFVDSTGEPLDYVTRKHSSAFNALDGVRDARTLVNMGFTTIRIPGDFDRHYANIEIRDAISRGEFVGPRMLVAPHTISPLGGHGDYNSYAPDGAEILGPMVVDGVENLRSAVRREIKYGADWIKVMASGGVMSQHDDPTVAAYSAEEFKALADETHRHKKKITAHAHGDAGIRAAVEAGFDSIEHATMLSDETIRLMVKKGTYYVPTLYVLDWILEMGSKGGITANNLAKAKKVTETHADSVRRAYKAGVKMALGSDQIFPMEQSILEFQAMAKRIPDNWYVLQMGTINAADMLGLKDSIGSLKVGKQADIVAMLANPIEDIRAVEQIHFVMKGGELIRTE